LHRYWFPENTKEGNVLVDLIHRDIVLDSYLEVVDAYTVKGYRFSKSWANKQQLFFIAKFNKPIIKKALHISDTATQMLSTTIAKGKAIQAGFTFDVSDGKPLLVQVALSPVSMEGAALNLAAEQPDFDFDHTLQQNTQSWNKELSKIEIESNRFNNVDTIFYSALYHTMIVPNIYQDVDGQYRGTDDKIHKAVGYTNYTVFSLWDTYRAYHPLMSILNKDRTRDWIHTFLNQYKQGGMLPIWELSANETFCMIGYHSIPVIVDAYKKGITDFDTELALEAMLSYSQSTRFAIDTYAKNGFLSNDAEAESVSKTMEYAYDDWCIAEFAKALGKNEIAATYYKRSQYYKNLFNPATGFFQGKLHGKWMTPFDPNEINNFYTEGNAWHYSMAAPQDIEGMKALYGGNANFTRHLEKLFTTETKLSGREQADVTGLIGQYAQGNEPSHHMAYLFNYSTKPDLTAFYINKICNEFYKNTPDGLIGNEDCGQMSAWYIWSALGLYPLNPASNAFEFGAPQLKKAIIHLENGKDIRFDFNRKDKNAQFPSIPLFNNTYISNHKVNFEDLKNGNTISVTFGNNKIIPAIPFSAIEKPAGENIVTAPYIVSGEDKFRNQTMITLGGLDQKASIRYFIDYKNQSADAVKNTTKEWTKDGVNELQNDQSKDKPAKGIPMPNKDAAIFYQTYTKPFVIQETATIYFYSEKDGAISGTVAQPFYKMKDDKYIRILTKVNPMYTAGGNESLIDGIIGSSNWRAGEWQSYYGNDFEAIIDLKKEKNVQQIKSWFLQDTRSWIWMPKEMTIATSNNGKDFTFMATVKNTVNEKDENTGVYTMQLEVTNLKTRYIKISAKNYGTIPAWHLGAGNQAHLFISEIEIK
jgi:predicted alpha-1,2-mannosidase